jgi:hypothetical protein
VPATSIIRAIIAQMMEAAGRSQTSVNFYQTTWRNNPEDIIRANIAQMLETACTSETSVNFYQTTRRNNPEDSPLHIRRRENLKSHPISFTFS